jgi:saccharopine dehydrogenase (NAD+, L-lysine-forming)
MPEKLKIGILRETRKPPDRRVPLTPKQIITLTEMYPHAGCFVQPGDFRCYSDDEYKSLNIPLKEDLSDCDILMGIKEVDKSTFIPGKTYMFFAHVGKKQPHNREMFRRLAEKNISLIDYEYLTDDTGKRIIAFGRWAGIVGAYNGLRAMGLKTGRFELKPAHKCHDFSEMLAELKNIDPDPGLKIILTGGGRVANGALETLTTCNIKQVGPDDFLNRRFSFPVVCQIGPEHYTSHKAGKQFNFSHFAEYPEEYESAFLRFTSVADLLIAGHYWDPRSPVFFTKEDMQKPGFRISVIADISCDVNGPIPSTLRPSTIADPFYGYNPNLGREEPAFVRPSNITVMAIDNLPGELPRDASSDFGNQLMQNVLNDLLSCTGSPMIERATILKNGKLTDPFKYLSDYLLS